MSCQSKDTTRTPLHLHFPHHADLFEDFTRTHLAPDEIYVPPQHQPLNPEDEDDVVPDQHAAFGITRAMGANREPAWRDLGLEELVRRRPEGNGQAVGSGASGGTTGLALRVKSAADARSGRVNRAAEGSRSEGLPR